MLIQHVADVQLAISVPRHAFTPPPEVESAALVLEFLEKPRAAVQDERRFRVLVKAAFSQRTRRTMNLWRQTSYPR